MTRLPIHYQLLVHFEGPCCRIRRLFMDSSSFSREVKVLGPNCSKTRELASSSCACLFAWAYSRTFFGQCLLLLYVTCGYCDVWTPTITISTLLLPCMPAIGGTNNLVRFRDADTNGREDKAHGTYLPLTFPQRGTRHSVSEVYCHTFYPTLSKPNEGILPRDVRSGRSMYADHHHHYRHGDVTVSIEGSPYSKPRCSCYVIDRQSGTRPRAPSDSLVVSVHEQI